MKNFTFLILFSLFGYTYGQVPANRTVYDCNNNSKNIYATLATGKSIIIAHKGVDCSICRSTAPGWQTWAAANSTNVEVWGALTYTYSSSAFPTPTQTVCDLTQLWETRYGWNDIFTFPDSNRLWFQGSSPRYYVYSAIDSSIVYQGSSSTLARSNALAQSTVGLNSTVLDDAKIYSFDGQIIIKDLPIGITEMKLFNTSGQLVFERDLNTTNSNFDVSEVNKGIYILQFSGTKGTESKRLLF